MNAKQKKLWLEALDKYPKTCGKLRDPDGYCCLGVAADIFGDKNNWEYSKFGPYYCYRDKDDSFTNSLPRTIKEELKLTNQQCDQLILVNDSNPTFKEVKKIIEAIEET